MTKKLILVLNCGSSSIKFAVIDTISEEFVLSGFIQRIGEPEAGIRYYKNGEEQASNLPNIEYRDAVRNILFLIDEIKEIGENLFAIGHRVVHGGEQFKSSVLIDGNVFRAIRNVSFLAPLHNPANIIGIEESVLAFPKVPQAAVFDTSFHQTLPDYAYIYPLPYDLYLNHDIRRYGFHGTSHRFVCTQAANILGKDIINSAFIVAHLGNGCSVASVLNGKSIDTSMGLTPLEGLMMGTRCGDIDPGLQAHLVDNLKYDISYVVDMLNKKSGLLGVSGISSDMREIEQAANTGNKKAKLAFEIFCFRAAKYIAAMSVSLNKIDALIFTGGIGENSFMVRSKILEWLKILNFEINKSSNNKHGKNNNGIITEKNSTIAMVIITNEALMIAKDTEFLSSNILNNKLFN